MEKFIENTLEKIEKIQLLYSEAYNNITEDTVHDLRVSIRRLMANFYFIEKNFNDSLEKEEFCGVKNFLKEEFSRFGDIRDYQVAKIILDKFERDNFHNFDVRYMISEKEEELFALIINNMDVNKFDTNLDKIRKILGEINSEVNIELDVIEKVEVERAKFLNLAIMLNESSDIDTFHKVRIKIKKYRYFMELSEELGKKYEISRFERIKNIQDEFGKLQDYRILKNILYENDSEQSYISFLEFEIEIQKNIILDILKLYLL